MITDMKDRILEFLRVENKSSAQFAEEIGVQPSGISHILSGRNNPSLDFVMKMLDKYRDLSVEWLLFGKGKMFKSPAMQSLFDESKSPSVAFSSGLSDRTTPAQPFENYENKNEKQLNIRSSVPIDKNAKVIKIVWFYDDKSFEEYFPGH